MQKITQALLSLILPVAALAQPTVTVSDLPVAGSHWAELHDGRTGVHTVTAAGASQTWDYSTGFFQVSDTSFTDFISLSSIPAAYAAGWPSSDFAVYSAKDSSATIGYSSTNGLYIDGTYNGTKGAGTNNKTDYSPDDLYIPAPFTYSSTRTSRARVITLSSISGFSLKDIQSIYQSYNGDAWGTLKTPAGNQGNTVRIKEYSYSFDSLYVDYGTGYTLFSHSGSTTGGKYTYIWMNNNTYKTPLMSVGTDSAGNSTGASYFDSSIPTPLGIKNTIAPQANVKVYPNPVSTGELNFSFENNADAETLTVVNAVGQLIRNENITGANIVKLQTSEMPAGTYFYSIRNKDGASVKRGNFSVVK